MKWPKVSLIISTFNRPQMLEEALESALNQTYDDFEVVVVDDGSDTARPVLEKMADRFKEAGITLAGLDLEENTGYQCVPKNIGIAHCNGSYVAYLDDDNLLDPDHLSVLVEEIEKMGCEAVYSRWRYAGDGPVSGEFPYHQMNMASAAGIMQSPMLNFIDSSSILHSKGAFVSKLGSNVWNPEVRRFGDWEMVCRSIQANLRWRGVDKATFTYRWHGENLQLTRPVNESTVGLSK